MHSFCLLTSQKLILRPNCSILYLHSNNNKLKSLFLEKKVAAINIIVNCLNKQQMLTTKQLLVLLVEWQHYNDNKPSCLGGKIYTTFPRSLRAFDHFAPSNRPTPSSQFLVK